MATSEKERRGIGAGEIIGGAFAGMGTGFVGAGIAFKNNQSALNGNDVFAQVEEVVARNIGIKGDFNTYLETISPEAVDIIEEQITSAGVELKNKTLSLKVPQIAVITCAVLAAAGLTMWGINAHRNRNTPDPHIAALTAQLDYNLVQSPNLEGIKELG